MHRQSLGSSPSSSKLQCHGVLFSGAGAINNDNINNNNNVISEDHRNDKSAPYSTAAAADDEERKSQKPNQQKPLLISSSSYSSSRLIHLIPILTFFCFLILYLFSHDPSDKNPIVDDNVGGGSMAIRSMRSLQQRHRFNRKFRY